MPFKTEEIDSYFPFHKTCKFRTAHCQSKVQHKDTENRCVPHDATFKQAITNSTCSTYLRSNRLPCLRIGQLGTVRSSRATSSCPTSYKRAHTKKKQTICILISVHAIQVHYVRVCGIINVRSSSKTLFSGLLFYFKARLQKLHTPSTHRSHRVQLLLGGGFLLRQSRYRLKNLKF